MIVLHYTGMASAEAALARLTDPAAEVSAHYLIGPKGRVVRLVSEEMRAWHAGVARWGAIGDVNSHSIGIELVNPGHELGYTPYPEPQMAALEELLSDLLARHRIAPERVVGHACVAPGRKADPGEKLDWRRLARGRLAVWLDPRPGADGPADAVRFQAAASRFGYAVPAGGEWCAQTLAVWRAFAMRFLPARVPDHPSDHPSAGGVAHLERLAERWPCTGRGDRS